MLTGGWENGSREQAAQQRGSPHSFYSSRTGPQTAVAPALRLRLAPPRPRGETPALRSPHGFRRLAHLLHLQFCRRLITTFGGGRQEGSEIK